MTKREPRPCLRSIPIAATLSAALGCASNQVNPDQPIDAAEASSGWTDAAQDKAARLWIWVMPGATTGDITLDQWVSATSGNERAGRGATQAGGKVTADQAADVSPEVQTTLTPN